MGILLIILQVIGALPGIIQALQDLWELIKEIRDKRQRLTMRTEFRGLVFKSLKAANANRSTKLTSTQNEALMTEVDDLDRRIQEVLLKQE